MQTEKKSAEETAVKKQRSLPDYLGLVLRGAFIGAAEIVPGVSGGTIAFILGVYEELIDSIRTFGRKKFIQPLLKFRIPDLLEVVNWEFLIALGVGMFLTIFALSAPIEWMFENQPVYLWSFFFGLMIASVITVSKRIEKWSPPLWGMLIMGTLFAYFLVGLVPTETPDAWWFLMISGAIASVALILPGISGSFILLLMGKYQYVVSAVRELNFAVLIFVALGAGLGLISFAQFLSWLFKKYHDLTIAILTGFMIGSLRKIWPWREATDWLTDSAGNYVLDSDGHRRIIEEVLRLPDFSSPEGITQFVIALVCMIVGFGIIIAIDRFAPAEETA